MRVMMIAGEASGDLHGSGVVRELKYLDPDCDIFGIGGDKMQAAGMELVYHVREISVMGFQEVIQKLPLIKSIQQTMAALLNLKRPDVLVLIDYPGFNLRFAQLAHKHNVKIVYYISPQVWAWRDGRIRKMKGLIDKMLVVLPFEVEIYKNVGINVEFVGHPLLDVITEPQTKKGFCKRYDLDEQKYILGLFPGSRRQEIERIFPVMLGAARMLHNQLGVQTVVGVSSALELDYIKSFVRHDFPIQLIQHATHDVMKNSDVALVTSGTATLETAYYQTPMIIVYKTSWVSYLFGRLFVKINNIGLVNILADERIVPELIQSQCNSHRLAQEAMKMFESESLRKQLSGKLSGIKEKLGTAGASKRVVQTIVSFI